MGLLTPLSTICPMFCEIDSQQLCNLSVSYCNQLPKMRLTQDIIHAPNNQCLNVIDISAVREVQNETKIGPNAPNFSTQPNSI